MPRRTYAGLRSYPKGVSGNPKGRPRLSEDVRHLAKQHAPEMFMRLVQLARSAAEPVACRAAEAVLDRALGKPTQALDVLTLPEQPAAVHASPPEILAALAELRSRPRG